MKILVIGNVADIYTVEFITEILSKTEAELAVLSIEHNSADAVGEEKLEELGVNIYRRKPIDSRIKIGRFNVGVLVRNFFAYGICRNYDLIIALQVGKMSLAIPFFASSKSRIVLCYYGSDLLRIDDKTAKLLRNVVQKSNSIVVENENMCNALLKRYGSKLVDKVVFAHYGTNNARFMHQYFISHNKSDDKIVNCIPLDKLSVLVGYSGARGHRHVEIIRELSNLSEVIKNKLYIIAHCAYGIKDDYASEIEREIEKSKLEGRVITTFFSGDELAAFRNSIDIMLNLQATDCMAASMVECMEAGAVVIKGDWLDYPDINRFGGYLESISDLNELGDRIKGIVNDYQAYSDLCKKNRGIISLLQWNYHEWEKIF